MFVRRPVYISVCILVSYGLLLVVTRAEQCLQGQSNYTKEIWVTQKVTVSSVESTQMFNNQDCFIFKSWFDKKNECGNKTITVYRIVQTQRYLSMPGNKTVCCMGYALDENGTCTIGCRIGTFGSNCSEICTCPDNAYQHCDRDTGHCTCRADWTGLNCTDECLNDHFGDDCANECNCSNNGTCDKMTGCKCTPGWTSPTCNTRCLHNTFGHSCNETCTCNSNQLCDPVDGKCECKPGWTGVECHTECGDGMYGYNCSMSCMCDSNHSESCSKDLGICNCDSGYFGSNCSQLCPIGYHGKGCSQTCSHCINTPYCDPVNGTCICIGKTGYNCTEDCDNGKYGIACEMPCNCHLTTSHNMSCHNVTGQCSCQAGWGGNTCDTAMRQDDENDKTSVAAIGGAVGGAIVVSVLVVLLIGTVFRKQRRSKENVNMAHTYMNTSHEDSGHNRNEETALGEVDEGYEIPISNPGNQPEVDTTREYEEVDDLPRTMQRLSADDDGDNVVIETGNTNMYEPLRIPEINTDVYSQLE